MTNHTEAELTCADPVHDRLTGFANRTALDLVVDYAVARARRDGQCLTLLWFDIDGMGEINERYGREVGDATLVEFGELLRGELRTSDVVARIGGDEFAVLLSGADATQAGVVINHITAVVRERNNSRSHPCAVSAFVTRATFEPSGDLVRLDSLIAEAVARMEEGRGVLIR